MRTINTEERLNFLQVAKKAGFTETISRQEAIELANKNDIPAPNWLFNDDHFRHSRGNYYVNKGIETTTNNETETMQTNNVIRILSNRNDPFIPEKNPLFVTWGHFEKVKKIIESKKFFPTFITGLSGNGKTLMIEQACAHTRREFFRANITELSDEDELIGGFRLVNGEMIFVNGPVLDAYENGGVLLLDEIDLGSNKLMCLQPVLEGKPIFVKKLSKWFFPKEGFQIFATANTKGLGDETSKFIGTNVMNEAMLERFPVTLEQPYPDRSTEKKIIGKAISSNNITEKELTIHEKSIVDVLLDWAGELRESYRNGASEHVITTRRMVMIVDHFGIFRNWKEAIADTVSRFDEATKISFLNIFEKLLPDPDAPKCGTDMDEKKEEIEGYVEF